MHFLVDEVANVDALGDVELDKEIASEIYSTAGEFDLLVKFYIAEGVDIGHFVNEEVHSVGGIRDTLTTMTFRAF